MKSWVSDHTSIIYYIENLFSEQLLRQLGHIIKMILIWDKSVEQVDASFIKDGEHTRKVGKLQEIICLLDEKNFSASVDKIAWIGFTSDILGSDLARNIIHLSCFHRSKTHLFVRLVSEL